MKPFDTIEPKQARSLNGLVLAYVGDAVQSLIVRTKLATEHDFKAGELHKLTSQTVNARAQADMAEHLLAQNLLTEDEKDVFMRARNGKSHHKAKNAAGSDYRKASGLEAVIGYLYLIGNYGRIEELLSVQPMPNNSEE